MDLLKHKKEASSIVNYLLGLSCCYRCILRLLGVQIFEQESAYKNPKDFLNQIVADEHLDGDDNLKEPLTKKIKLNVCPVCLDCFEQKTVEQFVGLLNVSEYNYNNFFFNISLPKCLALRAHSMLIHLKKQFPDYIFGNLYEKKVGEAAVVLLEQPHKIFRATAADIIAKALGKQYHPKSNLNLLITLGYENDNLEVANMKNIVKKRSSKKNPVEISRNNIAEYLKDTDDKLFEANFSVPPEVPDKGVILENVHISADPIYIGGRYMKFKRNVGQTPWVIDGVSVAEHNVQDIIFDAVVNVLRFNKNNMTFTASGREDVDVRMLGTGRPFYIKIENPKQRQISSDQFLEIERQVLKTELAAVIKLQSVHPSELNRIKFGEEMKKKTYRALCKTTAPNIKDAITLINKQENLNISQLTVMRVLHRRTLMERPKVIHKMKAIEVPDHDDLFELQVETQAGTYVKEFVHGDFERTRPSISSLVGYPTDLVALDCIDINLIWPEDVTDIKSHSN